MRSRQSGFTLIELLVALVVGLVLTLGLINLTSQNKITYTNQGLLSQLQDNERFALTVMNDVIQAGGYYPDPIINSAATDMPVNPLYPQFTTGGQPLAGTARVAGTTPASISVQYALATNDAVNTCAGQQNGGGQTAFVSQFTVVPNAANPTQGTLVCTVTSNAGGPLPPVTLVTGVTDMDIRYGLNDLGSSTTHDVTEYKTADQMLATDWMNVTSVQVTLTFANPLSGQPGVPVNSTISIMRTIDVMTRAGITT